MLSSSCGSAQGLTLAISQERVSGPRGHETVGGEVSEEIAHVLNKTLADETFEIAGQSAGNGVGRVVLEGTHLCQIPAEAAHAEDTVETCQHAESKGVCDAFADTPGRAPRRVFLDCMDCSKNGCTKDTSYRSSAVEQMGDVSSECVLAPGRLNDIPANLRMLLRKAEIDAGLVHLCDVRSSHSQAAALSDTSFCPSVPRSCGSGQAVDGRVVWRKRGCRGKGARARGRITLRKRMVVRGCCSATGNFADACNGTEVLSKSVGGVCSSIVDQGPDIIFSESGAEPFYRQRSRETFLAECLQRAWRKRAVMRCHLANAEPKGEGVGGGQKRASTRIELGWTGKHKKTHGDLVSHVRFLQWLFRLVQSLSPGAWGSRSVPSWIWMVAKFCRRPRFTKCKSGSRLASHDEFVAQQILANEMLDWYGHYVAIFRRLLSGDAPRVFDDFCGGGAVAEGIRRAGGVAFGDDFEDQPAYKARFGPECFTLGDGVDWSLVRRLQKRFGLRLAGASPPCKWYSTARKKGESKQPPLIGQTRDMLQALFDWWWIENVMGAKDFMSGDATEIDGPYFGLKVFRSRLFETNFKLHVDEVVRRPADALRARMCLGRRNRWRTFDEFGRPYTEECCKGNTFVPIGVSPWRCTSAECAHAMGMDVDHMPYDRLAQAVPPAYSQWVFSQMCMRIVGTEYHCPIFTFDEMRADPFRTKRALSHWLRGAGFDKPSAGMSWVPRRGEEGAIGSLSRFVEAGQKSTTRGDDSGVVPTCEKGAMAISENPLMGAGTSCSPDSYLKVACRPAPHIARGLIPEEKIEVGENTDFVFSNLSVADTPKFPRVDESSFRELYYSHFGGFDAQWSELGGLPWLSSLRECESWCEQGFPTVEQLVGRNTYLEVSARRLNELQQIIVAALEVGGRGTRMTVVTNNTKQGCVLLGSEPFNPIHCKTVYGGDDALKPLGLMAAWCGRRAGPKVSSRLQHSLVEHAMDERDREGYKEDKEAKKELTWTPISHDPALWRGKGMPADVEAIMTEGVRIEMDADSSCFEQPQYPFPDGESMLESLLEADRALAVGHMEYVPDEHVEAVVRDHVVHPWLMVWQGKWRLCQDYSDGTNRAAKSGPFGLPSPWDPFKALKPGSYMSKYDLRDFFWSIPVHPDSRCRLVMRHPGSGRLMWCRALPFGYLDSPRQACRVSEALAGEMRKRVAGKGIHFFCYVDDYLVVGDTLELTREGERIFEEVMREFGMQWAPAKQRGPVQCLEFLGLLLCNVPGHRCIALTEKRQIKLRGMLDEWLSRRPKRGEIEKATPVELAKLLGHLVFASQVVPGGRTYMQNMLSAFGGLEIDWKHGRVRAKYGAWDRVHLSDEFWIDLEWWSDHLESRNCIRIDECKPCEALIAGTDASDWGAGTVVWIDGHKEECNLEFTHAERRRPINFRELLGIVRVVRLYGHRLIGCKVMIETDNMAAKGAAEKLASTAASMQEMLRRLFELAEQHRITVVLIHTPGAKLFRPDQTSRGDPIEEPRVRLNREAFAALDARFGPFSEFVGAERRHPLPDVGRIAPSTDSASALGAKLAAPVLWVHPAHNTVGSALRLIGERMAGYDGDEASHRGPPPTGIVIVPYAPEAHWWRLTRHFARVGCWEVGDSHLEMNQMGVWRPVKSRRASLALAFPRSTGTISPVEIQEEIYMKDMSRFYSRGFVRPPDKPKSFMLPLLKGSFVYSPTYGELLLVWDSFQPQVAGRELTEEGELRVSCAELLSRESGYKPKEYFFVADKSKRGGSFADGGKLLPWELQSSILWTVDHLVTVDAPLEQTGSSDGRASQLCVASLEKRVFTFDRARAEREIENEEKRLSRLRLTPMPGEVEGPSYSYLESDRLQMLQLEQADTSDDGEGDDDLAAARASANEAAELRKRQREVVTPSKKVAAPPSTNRRETVCKYSAQRCEGCNGKFNFGEKLWTGFRSMVHQQDTCLAMAHQKHVERMLATKAPPPVPGAPKAPTRTEPITCTLQAARMATLTDGERLTDVRCCLKGECGIGDETETRLMCLRGCGRGLHLVTCARTSKSYAAAGRLICLECRLEGILEHGTDSKLAPASLVQQVTLAMIAELTSGAVSTAKGRDGFATLERRWVMEACGGEGCSPSAIVLPRHSIESFAAFTWWLVTDADRARSFATLMRTAGAVMTMLELVDWTKTSRIKAQIKEVEKRCGVEPEPCTQTTRLMIDLMLHNTIKAVCSKGRSIQLNLYLEARTEMLLILELLAGLRVGEATSSGDLHGLDANNLCMLRPACSATKDDLDVTIEVAVTDSKTGPGRHAAFVGETRGPCRINAAWLTRRWLSVAGVRTETKYEGGYTVVRPNYWVARVNVASMSQSTFNHFLTEVEKSQCEEIAKQAKAIHKYAKERYKASTLEAELRYVNVAGGHRLAGVDQFDEALMVAVNWLEDKGFGHITLMVPGPLVRATHGKTLTHMPLATTSTYTHLVGAMKLAYEETLKRVEPDVELDLQGLKEPKWGNHSLRRHGDKVARESIHKHPEGSSLVKVTKQLIDYFFGWLLKEMSKDMQTHYAGLDRPSRRGLARVTMFF